LYYETNPDLPSQVKMVRNRKYAEGIISGRVTDRNKAPLPGTSIVVRGKDLGTVADADGRYEINAQKGDTLEFTFVGYNSAAAVVGKKNGVDVIMEEDIAALSEIVVIGYGEQQKTLVTGSLSDVGYLAVPDSTAGDYYFSQPLAAAAMGVQVMKNSGDTKQIMIRGQSSVTGGSKPLYVVDGVVVTDYKVTEADIDQIQILKGDAAIAIYGSRGANGVVVLTTKSGQKKLDEEMAKITARKNFNETAFFFPQLRTNEEGRVHFTFTIPESVTRWKMQLLAHTKTLEVGSKVAQVITQKDLMVTPNAPRFLRVDDEIIFSTKITNLTTQPREGSIALQLTNAMTGQSIDAQLGNTIRNQTFRVNGKSNKDVFWKLTIPAGIDAVQYKVVAKTGKFSDGEQNAIPVLSNRMLVTETMAMYVRSGQTKTYTLDKLASSATTSTTLQHHQVTLEFTSNPVWYAIQSMPYLMEFPHECAEQLFSRYYANALASHLVNGNPKVKAVFDQWSSAGELVSNLEKNQELKSIIIQETPWLRDAQNETEQKKRIAILFDLNQMSDQMNGVISKLEHMQLPNGGFPWFSGGNYPSRYITQHVACGAGHLRHLKVNAWENADLRDIVRGAITFLDSTIVDDHRKLLKEANLLRTKEGDLRAKKFLEEMHVYRDEVHYLYMRSFFEDIKPSTKVQAAIDYYTAQSGKFWKEQNLYSKTMTALVQYRSGNVTLASEILHSIKENAVVSDDMGMYWKENKPGWYWNEAPVETQALLIEAFTEIESSNRNLSLEERTKSIDEMRICLLKNKQTTQWRTTKATTEAIYALMLQGTDWTSVDKVVEVKVGGENVIPKSVEAGTGYFKKSWSAPEVKPSMGSVTLTHKGEGIAWGGMYWQYFEDLDKITGAETPLRLTKKVFVVRNTDQGEVLTEINKGIMVKVGDLVRVRIELKVNQAMEFLHMKDMRASGLEPVDVLSAYRWQDGLGYYQSTKDASTSFFFDSVREGVYVFEYDLRANNKGDFSNGITTIQSMYAPEFSSHSEGVRIVIE
jgi:TonB-dependent SusC/RagA subfamily outer membrane receptor